MRKLPFLTLFFTSLMLAFSVSFVSCTTEKGDPGPQGEQGPAGAAGSAGTNGSTGPAGATGPKGAAGQDGNANVIQYSFGARSWANTVSSEQGFSLAGVDANMIANSAYFAYVRNGNFWYSVPGQISSFGEFRTYTRATGNPANVYITRTTTGNVLDAEGVRIILIPASVLRNGRQVAVDYSNYAEVKAYYNLPD